MFGADTVWLVGSVDILGNAYTVSVAGVVVSVPAVLVTTHSYSVPLLATDVAEVVYDALVAPTMDVHVLPLLVLSCH